MRLGRSALGLVILASVAVRLANADPQHGGIDEPKPSANGLGVPAILPAFAADRWGAVGVQLRNPTDRPVEITTATHFEGQENLQYGRKFWMPANSSRSAWQLIKTPDSSGDAGTWVIKSYVEMTTDGRAVVIPTNTGEMAHSSILRHHDARVLSGILSEAERVDVFGDEPAYESLLAMRFGAGLPRRVALLKDTALPPVAASLDSLDQLVISGNDIAATPASIRSVQQWVQRGGRLWLLLDRVDISTVESLFGDAVDIELVDRVGLTEIRIDEVGENAQQGETRSYERPVELVRVLASDVEVVYTVNQWPAAFWKQIGRGEVLFTALAPHGWMRLRMPSDPRPANEFDDTRFVPQPELEILGERFLKPAAVPAVDRSELEPFLVEQIGYRIVSRRFVAAVLLGFCGLLAGAGLVFNRIERPQQLAPAAVVLSLVAAAAIGLAALREKQAAPPTVGVAQFVEAPLGAGSIDVSGLATLYHQEPSSFSLGSRRGGMLSPDMTALEGDARRLLWEDLDHWSWRNLTLPAGIRAAEFHTTRDVAPPIACTVTYGPDGLSGHLLAAPFENISDAVLVTTSSQSLAVRLDEEGRWQAGPGDVLPPGQLVAGALISDEQLRRRKVLAALTDGPRFEGYIQQPTLLFWADPLDMGFDLPPAARRIGSALVAAPVAFRRSPAGTRVVIPSPMFRYRGVRGPRTTQLSSVLGNKTGEWLPRARFPTEVWLEFDIPEYVLPLEIERATLQVRIEAPGRTLELFALDQQREAALLRTLESPADLIRTNIENPQWLQPVDGRGLQFGIVVGPDTTFRPEDAERGDDPQPWTIESVELQVEGVTQ